MSVADSIKARPRYVQDKRANLDHNTILTRYLTDAKFRDLFGTQSLFFSRLVNLRSMDPDEGKIATSHYLADAMFRESDGTNAPAQRDLYRRFIERGPHQQAYVSCWYIGVDESERMWSEYVPDGNGVAVQTTVGLLIAQFDGVYGIKEASAAPIQYVDFDEASMAGIEERDDNVAALKYKGESWIHENEFRAILLYNMYYIAPVLPKHGERLCVPIDQFLQRIIVAPNASDEYKRECKELVSGSSIEKMLTQSAFGNLKPKI